MSDLQSAGVSASRSRYLSWVNMRAKQQSRLPPAGSFGRSSISLPSTMASQLLCKRTNWSGGAEAWWHTRRLPSAVRSKNRFFHCLKRNPPWQERGGKKIRILISTLQKCTFYTHCDNTSSKIQLGRWTDCLDQFDPTFCKIWSFFL